MKTREGLELVSEEEVKKHKEVEAFIPIVRNAVSKAWRMLDKLDKMLTKKGSTLIDVVQVAAMFVFLVIPFVLIKLWWWVGFWAVILFIFTMFEVVSYIVTKQTLSQQFGAFKRKNPVAGWGVLVCLALGWACLIWHLM